MNTDEIEQYMKSKYYISIPEIQKVFGLSYREAHVLFKELMEKDVLEYKNKLLFCYLDEDDKYLNMKSLWLFISKNKISVSLLMEEFGFTRQTAERAILWMKDKKYISMDANPVILITKKEFEEKFDYGLDEEEETKEDLDLPPWMPKRKNIKKTLDERRAEIKKRIDDLEHSQGIEEKYNEYKIYKNEVYIIMKSEEDISKTKFLDIANKKKEGFKKNPKMTSIYEKIINEVSTYTDAEFEQYKYVVLF